MASNNTTTINLGGFWAILFIVVKLMGTSLASWSWWLIFLPIVPFLGLLVKYLGL